MICNSNIYKGQQLLKGHQHLYESYSHISGQIIVRPVTVSLFLSNLRFKIAIKRWYDRDLSEDY